MAKRNESPRYIASHIRRMLKDGGSTPHSEDVQRFFKEAVKSRGWYTAELRQVAVRFRRTILKERGPEFLLKVADDLFTGDINEEKNFAVFLLEKRTCHLGEAEFKLFESWLARIRNWSDHDALVHYVIAPMLADHPAWNGCVFRWARSPNRWYRRAACVALIQGSRRQLFFPQIIRVSNILLSDQDDMVQKGLGWLLRETAKADPQRTVPYLIKIRDRAPRLVLRTACETLPELVRLRILKPSPTGT